MVTQLSCLGRSLLIKEAKQHRGMPHSQAMPDVSLEAMGRCWNGIYLSLSNVRSRYEELKAQNPNITIIVEEISPKLKERFFDLIEIILGENESLNNGKAPISNSIDWHYGKCTEYFLKNDVLGTIVTFSVGNDVPFDLIDEATYLLASLINGMPASFLTNENILLPTARLLNGLISKPSKYSAVLCDKIVNRIVEFHPLFILLTSEQEDSFGRVLTTLFNNKSATKYVSDMYIRLLHEADLLFEDYLFADDRFLNSISSRIENQFEDLCLSNWSHQSSTMFITVLSLIDSLVQCFSEQRNAIVAATIKQNFVKEHLEETVNRLKLSDGSLTRALNLLSSMYRDIASIEICVPIGKCFHRKFFSIDSEDSIQRLLFVEGESQLSFEVIHLLTGLLSNKSRRLFSLFDCCQDAEESQIACLSNLKRLEETSLLAKLINLLPEQMQDKNSENVSLLYKSHLSCAELIVPQTSSELNIVDIESIALSGILVKIVSAFQNDYWIRTPVENMQFLALFSSLLCLCDMDFVQEVLMGDNKPFALKSALEYIVQQADVLKQHIERSETLRSISRFRGALYDAVHKKTVFDMFSEGGLLSSLLADLEARTVGAVSGNVLLLHCFLMRVIAIRQVQATRPYLTIVI